MQEIDLKALTTQVLWAAFGLSALFGAIAQRTRFCTMGAVADVVNIGDWTRMRMWALAMGVAIVCFNAMAALGWLDAGKSIYGGPRVLWLSALVGGAMFGFGMVLASGCGSKTLVRIGGGSLKSLVVFVVLGVAAFATLKGITAVARVTVLDSVALTVPTGQDLPTLLAPATGLSRRALALLLGGALGGALLVWSLARAEGRSAGNLLGGLGIGAVVAGVWWVSGVLGHVDEDPSTLQEAFVATNSQRMESLSFVSPIAYALDWLMFYSDASKRLTLGIVATAGVVLGSAAVALARRSFRWEGFASLADLRNQLVGAVLMGFGGVTALGCTIGQGLSGLSTLALGSAIAVAGIVAGGVATMKVMLWQAEREG